MICNNPIRVEFIIVNVNTVVIWSSQQIVAFRTFQLLLLIFENGELRLQLSFLDIKIHKQLHVDFYSDSNRVKEIYFGGRETAKRRDLSTSAICQADETSSRLFISTKKCMVLFSGSE